MLDKIVLEIAQNADIKGILELQELYLVSNLSEEEKASGFVTTPFTIPLLETVIAENGLFVAKIDSKIIAYMFGASWEFYSQWPIFEYMISLFPRYKFRDFDLSTTTSFQYGPVSIHKDFRGQGLLKILFEYMRIHMIQKYPFAVTFINKINIPSTKAHVEKLNLTIIDSFQFNNNDYIVLAYDMKVRLN
jgi:hypothetical protein